MILLFFTLCTDILIVWFYVFLFHVFLHQYLTVSYFDSDGIPNKGANIQESIKNGIENSEVVVVLMSPDYVLNRNCALERETIITKDLGSELQMGTRGSRLCSKNMEEHLDSLVPGAYTSKI